MKQNLIFDIDFHGHRYFFQRSMLMMKPLTAAFKFMSRLEFRGYRI